MPFGGKQPSAELRRLSFSLPPDFALSAAIETIKAAVAEVGMPETVSGSFQGSAQAFESSLSGMGLLLAMAIFVIYLVLGILYESFIHPITILSGIPTAALGALLTLYITPVIYLKFEGLRRRVG